MVERDTPGPVSGNTLSLNTALPNGRTVSSAATTDSTGMATFAVRSRETGTYTSTVLAVSKYLWEYDTGASAESQATVSVP